MSKFGRYLLTKSAWFVVTFIIALFFNFMLPRLMPGNPVDTMMARMSAGGNAGPAQVKMYQEYVKEFGLNDPIWQQFLDYLNNLLHGDMGKSFAQYPTPVTTLIGQALPWSIVLQVPAILIGWFAGNVLGVMVAYRKGLLDKVVFPSALFLSTMPFFCLAILLLYLFAVVWHVFPPVGGYSFAMSPAFTFDFFLSAAQHYVLPFMSLVLVFIGGQAIGMRSMSIYELDADYVRYSRSLGVSDNRISRYIFRNAMLPQVSGLALSLAGVVSGALIVELVFSYPGIGTQLFSSIRQEDYPVIQGITLVVTVAVLTANFAVDIIYGFIDPRIRAAQTGGR